MDKWRGVYAPKAIEALCLTVIAEATQQLGQLCPECNDSARVTNKNRVTRNCQCCHEGRITWTSETRFALFCQTPPITYFEIQTLSASVNQVGRVLTGQRTAAMLALKGRVEKEEQEALEVA